MREEIYAKEDYHELVSIERRLSAYNALGIISALLLGFALSLLFAIEATPSGQLAGWRVVAKTAKCLASVVAALNFHGLVIMG